MTLILTEEEYENYKKISKGICPKNCPKCLIYKLGLPCDGEEYELMLKLFKDAGNDEGIEIEIDHNQI